MADKVKVTLEIDPLIQASEIFLGLSQRQELLQQRIAADPHGARVYSDILRANQNVVMQLAGELERAERVPSAPSNPTPDEAEEWLRNLPVKDLLEMIDETVVDPDNEIVIRRKLKDMPVWKMVKILVPFMIDEKYRDLKDPYHQAAYGGDDRCWWDW